MSVSAHVIVAASVNGNARVDVIVPVSDPEQQHAQNLPHRHGGAATLLVVESESNPTDLATPLVRVGPQMPSGAAPLAHAVQQPRRGPVAFKE